MQPEPTPLVGVIMGSSSDADTLAPALALLAELGVAHESRIVFTSMLIGDYRPGTPWMPFTAVITMEDEPGGTRYVARVMHPDRATRDRHEELGFFDGWNTCIDQLEALASAL